MAARKSTTSAVEAKAAPPALRAGFKVLTHDYRPPIQGGDPVWDGATLPHALAPVTLDTSRDECGTGGYHYSADLATALRMAGFWPRGRPAVCVAVEAAADAIERGDKRRASTLTLTRRIGDDEVAEAIRALSGRWFGAHSEAMAVEQLAWRRALGRPFYDAAAVEAGLRTALEKRGLRWSIKRYESPKDAWAARDARDARDAWAAWDARDAWAAWDAWDAWAAWDARDAWDALTTHYAAIQGWVTDPADLLTAGIRDAYTHGLALAVPTEQNTLGYALVEAP